MSKAEKFISDCTMNCSNETTKYGSYDHTYHEWITPDQARKAVEIAREEVMQQMMANAIYGEVGYWNQRGLSVLMSLPSEFEEDDKCKIILIKED